MNFKEILKNGVNIEMTGKEIRELETKIADLQKAENIVLEQFGKYFFDTNMHRTDLPMKEQEFISEIKRIKQEKEQLEKQRYFMQGMRVCDKCKNVLSKDSLFCNRCGAKLEELSQKDLGNICKNCGATMDGDALFCQSCGMKIERG